MSKLAAKVRELVSELQNEVEEGAAEKRKKFQYRLEKTKVIFEQGVVAQHRELKTKLVQFLRKSKLDAVITSPIIYSLIIPIAMLDLFITIFQHVCFRVYMIPRVKRSEYVVMDRKYLEYLNIIQKINCIYCEYGNGVLAYAREVASRTEHFWCPIKHAKKVKGVHERYYEFIEYGDSEGFPAKLQGQREKCRACEASDSCVSSQN